MKTWRMTATTRAQRAQQAASLGFAMPSAFSPEIICVRSYNLGHNDPSARGGATDLEP